MEPIYVVTGANGFVGNNIVRALLAKNLKVRAYVRNKSKIISMFNDSVEIFEGDICDENALTKALTADTDVYVIHAAGVVNLSKKPGKEMYDANIEGARVVLSCCKKTKIKKLVFINSVHAVAEQKKGTIVESDSFDASKVHGAYAKTKATSAQLVIDAIKNENLNCAMFHPSGIIGPNDYGQTNLTKLIEDYVKGLIPAGVRGGYSFIDVRDIADAAIFALENKNAKGSYLLCGNYVSVKEVVTLLYKHLNKKHIRLILPVWVARIGLPFIRLYSIVRRQEPLYNSYVLYTLKSNGDFSKEKAAKDLGFNPKSFEESLKDTIAYLQETGRI